jgi:hypothetical protein
MSREAWGAFHDRFDHLIDGLGNNRFAAAVAVRNSGSGIQQPDEVVNFGYRAYRRTGVVDGGFLLDSNGRTETLDQIHIGFFQALKKLPGIGGQRFDIAALAFGIQGVEGQGGFTGPGQTGDHHQLVARQTKADVF